MFCIFTEINTFIQRGHIKIKGDSKDIYDVRSYLYVKYILFFLTFYSSKNWSQLPQKYW